MPIKLLNLHANYCIPIAIIQFLYQAIEVGFILPMFHYSPSKFSIIGVFRVSHCGLYIRLMPHNDQHWCYHSMQFTLPMPPSNPQQLTTWYANMWLFDSHLYILPFGKPLHNYGQSPCLLGQLTMSVATVNSSFSHYQKVYPLISQYSPIDIPMKNHMAKTKNTCSIAR